MPVDLLSGKYDEAVAVWRRDPVVFAEDVLGIKPYPVKKGWGLEAYQVEILRALASDPRAHVCVKSCHGAGKTFLDGVVAAWFLFCFGPFCKVITTAPVWRQVENIFWPQFRSILKAAPVLLVDPGHGHNDTPLQQTMLKLDDEWFAIGVSTNRPEDFEGWHADNLMFILDEAKGLEKWVFDSAEGLLGTGDELKMLATSTPGKDSGPFYECFSNEDWIKFTIDWTQVKRKGGLKRWAEGRAKDWGIESGVYRSKCLGEFFEDTTDCLIPLEWIDRARLGCDEEWKGKPVFIGVDVARHGDDESVITVQQGPRVWSMTSLQGADNVKVAAAVKEKHLKYGAVDIPVDTVGLGAGVHDILKSWGLPVREFKASHRPRDRERFKLFRDEAFWGLRERFRDSLIDLSQVSQRAFDRLLGQLHKMKFYADAMGRTCIEGKDEYRKRQSKMVGEDNARSPDYADSLCIANSRGVRMVFDYTGADFSAVRKSA